MYFSYFPANALESGFLGMRTEMEMKKALVKSALSQQGIALVLVLWIMTILMVIAASFTITSRIDAYSALSYRNGIENKYLAEAGIQRGIMEIVYRNINRNQTVTLKGKELLKTDGRSYTGTVGKGFYRFSLTDESGKININAMDDATGIVLKNLLIHSGVKTDQADVIVDSILDWKDADDLRRLSGAESDYYLSLPQPYRAKDADFDTLDELLLVKGMTLDILYGKDGKPGIIRFLTLSPETGFLINVNVAPREVLMAIPGMTAEITDRVLAYREIDDPSAVQRVLEDIRIGLGPQFSQVSTYIGTGSSGTYCIEAAGFRDNERRSHFIRSIIKFDTNNSYQYVYYKSMSGREGE